MHLMSHPDIPRITGGPGGEYSDVVDIIMVKHTQNSTAEVLEYKILLQTQTFENIKVFIIDESVISNPQEDHYRMFKMKLSRLYGIFKDLQDPLFRHRATPSLLRVVPAT